MGSGFSNIRSLTNVTNSFRAVDFYNELFTRNLNFDYAVVRENATAGLGRAFEYRSSPNLRPGIILPIAFSMAFNNLRDAELAVRARSDVRIARLKVILVSGNINSDVSINFADDMIICPYWNFVGSPSLSDIFVQAESLWQFSTAAIVNMNIEGRLTIDSSSNFAIANCYLNLTNRVRLVVGPSLNNYILNSELRGSNPLILLRKRGLINGDISIARTTLDPTGGDRTIFETQFSRGTAGRIIVNMIQSTAFGRRLNNKSFTAMVDTNEEGQDGELDVFWYNNIIEDNDYPEDQVQYIAKPAIPNEGGYNYLINATVLGDKQIDNSKFVKYRYTNKEAEIITNANCIKKEDKV